MINHKQSLLIYFYFNITQYVTKVDKIDGSRKGRNFGPFILKKK